jgi:hypothetical protein
MRDLAASIVQRAWRAHAARRFARVARQMRELSTCVICQDECVQLVRCDHGHGCCVGCALSSDDVRCPMCREARRVTTDATVVATLRALATRMRCAACGAHSTVDECETHRAWCPAHCFRCPVPSCTQCVAAALMGEHVKHHTDVVRLTRGAGERVRTYHLVIATTTVPPMNEIVVLHLDNDIVVVVEICTRRTLSIEQECLIVLALRAYYPSARAPALGATVRQILPSRCGDAEAWAEEYRLGTVVPMLASREGVPAPRVSAKLSPRSLVPEDVAPMCAPNAAPGAAGGLHARVRRAGLRDVPAKAPLLAPLPTGMQPGALVHLCLRAEGAAIADRVVVP